MVCRYFWYIVYCIFSLIVWTVLNKSDDDDNEIQAALYRKTKHPFEAKICVKMSFQLL